VEASQSVQAAPDLTWQIWAGAIGEHADYPFSSNRLVFAIAPSEVRSNSMLLLLLFWVQLVRGGDIS